MNFVYFQQDLQPALLQPVLILELKYFSFADLIVDLGVVLNIRLTILIDYQSLG